MNSLGIAPPLILLSTSLPLPASCGSTNNLTLANMFGYINNLRSMSQGRAQYSMFFDHYSKVPQNVQDEVTKKIAG